MNGHFSKLKNMYFHSEINSQYNPVIEIFEGKSEVAIPITPSLLHSGNALHGSIYFKVLDDSAFLAANSLEKDHFALTSTFTTYITEPVSHGILKAAARVVNQTRAQIVVESIAYNHAQEVARGHGIFVRSRRLLKDVADYKL